MNILRFVPSSAADALSAALWGLAKPPAMRDEKDTQAMFPWIMDLKANDEGEDPDEHRWLVVNTTFAIPVHPDAVLDGIADILQPWIDRQQLPAETNTQLAQLVESMRGQQLVVYDAFPQIFKTMSKNYEQMIAAGLLAEPVMP